MNELKIPKEIYNRTILKEACYDYSNIADIKLEENENYCFLTFLNCKYSVGVTIEEFENYVIDLQVKHINDMDRYN